jgi:signal transduction histidine kinase
MVNNADQLVNKAIQEIRSLSHSLIPPSFDNTDFSDGIDEMVNLIEEQTELKFDKQYRHTDYSNVSQGIQLTMYRTVQEQLNNILKYAKAKNVIIQTIRKGNELNLLIQDDGIGFDCTKKRMGVGFMNIQTRASLSNGTMYLKSHPGEGCSLQLQFKL